MAVLASACRREPELPRPPRPGAAHRDAAFARADTGTASLDRRASDALEIQRVLAMAYPDTAMRGDEFDALAALIPGGGDRALTRARVFASARRAPTAALSGLWAITPAQHHDALARGLAGRTRAMGPGELPVELSWRGRDGSTSTAIATVVSRLRLTLPEPPNSVVPLLTAAALDDQLVGARLLASPSVALPETGALALATPFALPALARSLASRGAAVPSAAWLQLIQLGSSRARFSPRQWGNAWRAIRDAVPTDRADLVADFRAGLQLASGAQGLPPLTSAWFRCENATVADKLSGWPAETLGCAPPGLEWVARTGQAEVLGSAVTEPARRAQGLSALVLTAQGHPQVLEAVAKSATALPVAAARALIRRLASERDPGVLAALLENLAAHPEHASALPPNVRIELLRAPFLLPEGPGLEARVEAFRLAHALRVPEAELRAGDTSRRALEHARAPDATVLPQITPPVAASPNARPLVRMITEAGAFEFELDPSAAPQAVERYLGAIRAHRYDGLTFHRIVPGFVAQGGDPRGDGYGGTDMPLPTEISSHPFDRGAIGVPLAGLDTGGVQMFFVTADSPHLDARYPWVGRVRRGIEVVDGLLPGDHIERVEIMEDE